MQMGLANHISTLITTVTAPAVEGSGNMYGRVTVRAVR